MKLYEHIGIIWYFKILAVKQQLVMFNYKSPSPTSFYLNFEVLSFPIFQQNYDYEEAFWGTETMKCIIHNWIMGIFNKTSCVLREKINR